MGLAYNIWGLYDISLDIMFTSTNKKKKLFIYTKLRFITLYVDFVMKAVDII